MLASAVVRAKGDGMMSAAVKRAGDLVVDRCGGEMVMGIRRGGASRGEGYSHGVRHSGEWWGGDVAMKV